MNTKKILINGEKEIGRQLHHLFDKKKKRIVIVLVFIAFVFLAYGIFFKIMHQYWQDGNLNRSRIINENPTSQNDSVTTGPQSAVSRNIAISDGHDRFAVPEDAAQKGELAMAVMDFDGAKRAISEIAKKNDGLIYSSNISSTSDNIKNGIVVVQIPQDRFEKVFDALKVIGTKIFYESTQKIEPGKVIYPMPVPQADQVEVQNVNVENNQVNGQDRSLEVEKVLPEKTSQPAVAPVYYPEKKQDKAYIKIIFADYGKNPAVINTGRLNAAGSRDLLIVFVIKFLFLIILFVLLVLIVIKTFRRIRQPRSGAGKKAITSQSSVRNTRVVKTKKK